MRIKIITAVVSFLILFQVVAAEQKIGINVGPRFSKSFGHTNYELNALVGYDQSTPIYARSKLEFPMDAVWGGAGFEIYGMNDGRKDWTAEISYMTNVNDPGGKMKDADWFTSPGYQSVQFGYTESDAVLTSFIINAEVSKRIYSWANASTYLMLGFRYQKIEQDIIGFSGWQLNDELEKIFFSGDEEALYYKVTYSMPMAGIKYNLDFNPRSSLALTAAYLLTFADDLDDHLLRYKVSDADGTGYGFMSNLYFRRYLSGMNSISRIYIDFVADFMTMKIETDQTQVWYGDDPATPEVDDTGTILPDIPHEITSLQFNLGVNIGVTF